MGWEVVRGGEKRSLRGGWYGRVMIMDYVGMWVRDALVR